MAQTLLGAATKPYTLVIVDMQPGFVASQTKAVIAGVLNEVRNAIAQNMPIVVVESDTKKNGKTHDSIMELLRGYDSLRWITVLKYYRWHVYYSASSGGEQVAEAASYLQFPLDRFRICGVNTHICVFFTALELSRIFPDCVLEIPLAACEDEYYHRREVARYFDLYANDHNFTGYVIEP